MITIGKPAFAGGKRLHHKTNMTVGSQGSVLVYASVLVPWLWKYPHEAQGCVPSVHKIPPYTRTTTQVNKCTYTHTHVHTLATRKVTTAVLTASNQNFSSTGLSLRATDTRRRRLVNGTTFRSGKSTERGWTAMSSI